MAQPSDFQVSLQRNPAHPARLVLSIAANTPEWVDQETNLSLTIVTQRLASKWEGILNRQSRNQGRKTIYKGVQRLSNDPIKIDLGEQPFFDFKGVEIESFSEITIKSASGQSVVLKPASPLVDDKKNSQSTATLAQHDSVSASKNFNLLPLSTRLKVYAAQACLVAITLAITIYGIQEKIWTWESSCSGSNCAHPALIWLVAIGLISSGVYWVRRFSLGTYIKLNHGTTYDFTPEPNKQYFLHNLLAGKSLIELSGAKVRIVCCNRERFQYLDTSGKYSNWTDGFWDFNAHLLFESSLPTIPAGAALKNHLPKNDLVSFDKMFEMLFPQAMVTEKYGISVYWAIQIIHDELVDREITVPGIRRNWSAVDFLVAPKE